MAAALDHVLALPVEPAVGLHLAGTPGHRVIEDRPPGRGDVFAEELPSVGVVRQSGQGSAEVDIAGTTLLNIGCGGHRARGSLVEAEMPQDAGLAVGGRRAVRHQVLTGAEAGLVQLAHPVPALRIGAVVEDGVGQRPHRLADLVGVVGAKGL